MAEDDNGRWDEFPTSGDTSNPLTIEAGKGGGQQGDLYDEEEHPPTVDEAVREGIPDDIIEE